MQTSTHSLLTVVMVIAATTVAQGQPAPLTEFHFPGALIRTALPEPAARETALRLLRLRPLLSDPTWGLPAGAPTGDFDVELFRSRDAFIAAGGPVNAAGIFFPQDGPDPGCAPGRVLALAGPSLTLRTWHVLQHECFHQFANAALHGRALPPWLDEGLAEYVGEALFTGDGYASDLIPPWRLARLQAALRSGELPPLRHVLGETRAQWTTYLTPARYDLVWSLVYFLKNADAGRFAPALADCVRQGSAAPLPPEVDSLWRTYWLSQPPNPTADRYAQAILDTLNSYLRRASAAGQRFDSFADFRAAAEQDRLRLAAADWLPPDLLSDTLAAADDCGTFTLVESDGVAHLQLRTPARRTLGDSAHH